MKGKFILDNNEEVEFDVILAFWWSKTNKHYLVYTDNKFDTDNKLKIMASIYYPDDPTKLEEIKTKEEWMEIDKRLQELKNEK